MRPIIHFNDMTTSTKVYVKSDKRLTNDEKSGNCSILEIHNIELMQSARFSNSSNYVGLIISFDTTWTTMHFL